MQFGFTLKPDHTLERTTALASQAETAGFEHGWLFDSHVLWRDPYPLLTLMPQSTSRMRLGTCVTNPATPEPSVTASPLAGLNELAGGPMHLGIGRGDSGRPGGIRRRSASSPLRRPTSATSTTVGSGRAGSLRS